MFKANKLTKSIFSLGLGTFLSIAVGLDTAVTAQNQQSNNGGFQSNEKDETFGDAPAGLNPLDLIHRAQQTNSRNSDEFNADSQGQLDNSVSDYKRLQQQKILEQQQQQSGATQVVETEIETVETVK